MPFSKYPRKGHPLAPKALATLLDRAVSELFNLNRPDPKMILADLDQTAWTQFAAHQCQRLADAIVERVRESWMRMPVEVTGQLLTCLPAGSRLEDLELETRTYNCLWRLRAEGAIMDATDLSKLCVGQICELPSFGAKSLVDLLTSMEGFASGTRPKSSRPAPAGATPKIAEMLSNSGLPTTANLTSIIGILRLPKIPRGLRLGDLPLKARAARCLRQHLGRRNLWRLNRYNVADLFEIPGFGLQSLVDFLHALKYALRDSIASHVSVDYTSVDSYSIRPQVLEEELRRLTIVASRRGDCGTARRNSEIAAAVFGFDGNGGATLEVVASRYQITKERVRQICLRIRRSIERLRSRTPILGKAVALITDNLPAAAEDLEKNLQDAGITLTRFKMTGIIRACEIVGRGISFELRRVGYRHVVVRHSDARMIRNVNCYARRAVRTYGAATVVDVLAQLQQKTRQVLTEDSIRNILQCHPDFEWVDPDGGWFWIKSITNNRIRNRIRKILSVSTRLDISELRGGISRHYTMKGYAPPRRVLLEICRRMPELSVDGTTINVAGHLNWRTTLRGAEYTIATVLRERGPVLSRADLEEHCLAAGMKRSTFYVYLGYSPIIERFAPGVYGLRGATVPPSFLESLAIKRPRTTVRLDHGWTAEGKIWVAYRISAAMLASGVASIPVGFRDSLAGTFELCSANGLSIGQLAVRDTTVWGLATLFNRRGGDVDDILAIIFDLKVRSAVAQIGDEELLDTFQNNIDADAALEVNKAVT